MRCGKKLLLVLVAWACQELASPAESWGDWMFGLRSSWGFPAFQDYLDLDQFSGFPRCGPRFGQSFILIISIIIIDPYFIIQRKFS